MYQNYKEKYYKHNKIHELSDTVSTLVVVETYNLSYCTFKSIIVKELISISILSQNCFLLASCTKSQTSVTKDRSEIYQDKKVVLGTTSTDHIL